MANAILVDQTTNVWSFQFVGSGGTADLPIVICHEDLIPKRVRWEPATDGSSVAGLVATIQDCRGKVVYQEIAAGAFIEPIEQRPREHEKWIGYFNPQLTAPTNQGITLTVLASGTIYIYI